MPKGKLSALRAQLHEKPLLIYGAGGAAHHVLPFLMDDSKSRVVGIAVTDKPQPWEGCPVPLRGIRDWTSARDCRVLIATNPGFHAAIEETCREYGFSDLLPLTTALDAAIIEADFERKGILLTENPLRVGTVQLVNPLEWSEPHALDTLFQITDMLYTPLFGDNRATYEGPYEFGEVALSANDIVFDLGANLGVFSAYAASKGCTAYAFEPTPELQPVLEAQSERNGKRIIPVPMAVSDRTGRTTFHFDTADYSSSSLFNRSSASVDIPIKQTSLDEFIHSHSIKRVDFIKADIEGAERLMLAGAKRVLREFAPKLALCTYHLPDDKEVMTRLILEANPNYKIEYCWKHLYAYV